MKPKLIDVKLLKKYSISQNLNKKKIIIKKDINYSFIGFNMICFIILMIGFYFLYIRYKNKSLNQKVYIDKITNLSKKINNNNNNNNKVLRNNE